MQTQTQANTEAPLAFVAESLMGQPGLTLAEHCNGFSDLAGHSQTQRAEFATAIKTALLNWLGK